MYLFFFHSQNPFFLYFDKCGRWHADSFFDRRTKTHNSLLFAYPVAVPRLPDAIYLIRLFSHGFKNPRLFAFGLASFRRLFLITRLSKPSGRRGLSSLWNMEVSIIKVVWKTGNLNNRWSFKPPGWSQTQHIMASGRREVK